MNTSRAGLLFLAVPLAALAVSCDTASGDGRILSAVPDDTQFAPVSEVLTARCGSLDCHGQTGRNLKLYSMNGLRYDSGFHSGSQATTDDEVAQNYFSVVSIEPEIEVEVLSEHAGPERLSIVRKARGTEEHKGGVAMPEGSDADVCLTSWLMGNPVDMTVCANGAVMDPPIQLP